MKRFHPARTRAVARALALSVLLAAPTRVSAQTDDAPAGPHGWLRHHLSNPAWGLHARKVPIPRTYSYYYAPWFNQPCHFRVVGPDGCTRWRTTVRGLPLGTPWPSYEAPVLP
jgi:hypothetical protein